MSELQTQIYTQPQRRIVYADLLRFFAMFAVVVIHATTLYLYDNNKTLGIWSVAVFYNILFRWCIPVFFMLSGMFLLKPTYTDDVATFIKKRFSKIAIPFVLWAIIYSVRVHDLSPNLTVLELLKMNLSGPIYYHLWFVYSLIGLYLVTPIIRVFVKHASPKELLYFLICSLGLMSVYSLFKDAFGIQIGFDLSYFTGFLGFFVLGYYLSLVTLTRFKLRIIYLAGIVGFLISFGGTVFLNRQVHFIDNNTFYSYLTPAITVTAIAVFLYFKNRELVFQNSDFVRKLVGIKNLSGIVFGMYLVHVLLLEVLKSSYIGFDFAKYAVYDLFIIPIFAVILFIVSFCVIYSANLLAEKIPPLKFLKLFY